MGGRLGWDAKSDSGSSKASSAVPLAAYPRSPRPRPAEPGGERGSLLSWRPGGEREKREERAACPQGRAGVQTRGRMEVGWGMGVRTCRTRMPLQIKTLLHLGRPLREEMGTVGCRPKRASKGQGWAEPRAELGQRLQGEVSGKTGQGDRGAGRCGRVGWGQMDPFSSGSAPHNVLRPSGWWPWRRLAQDFVSGLCCPWVVLWPRLGLSQAERCGGMGRGLGVRDADGRSGRGALGGPRLWAAGYEVWQTSGGLSVWGWATVISDKEEAWLLRTPEGHPSR